MKIISTILIFTLIINFALLAADGSMIERLRNEINEIESRVEQTEQGRRGYIQQVEDLDREIELRRRLIGELNKDARIGRADLDKIDGNIQVKETEIEALSAELERQSGQLQMMRLEIGNRINLMYRKLRAAQLTLLIGTTNLNDLAQRSHYIKSIEKYDKFKLEALRQQIDRVNTHKGLVTHTRNELTGQKQNKQKKLNQLNELINARKKEQANLANERSKKSDLLQKISRDVDLLHTILDERRKSLEDIEKEINRLEVYRPAKPTKFVPKISFSKLTGKLPWPLEKLRILQPYGQIKHPKLGTTVLNPGVDLRAEPGDPVFAVADGQVTRIAWLRGFGNTIILSHGDGYYTVYARLGTIQVSEGDVITTGTVLGDVGDSGVEGGFHFEIWAQRDKQNPVKWLKK